MPVEDLSPASHTAAGDPQDIHPDSSVEQLRRILLREQEARIGDLESDVQRLDHQIRDERSLIKMIAPVLGDAIRLKIKEARDEMIEALYPIIGQVVRRAVTEAVSDLARSLDAQAKRAFDLRQAWWRLRARFGGASAAQIRLRELLPFQVSDALLIHRDSGLLLSHLAGEASVTADSDLFGGMLTAIRDFSQDTLGGDGQDELGEITYGEQRILIETGRSLYLAVIVSGTPPPEYREEMRERLIDVENAHADDIDHHPGDESAFTDVQDQLQPLLVSGEPKKLTRSQKSFLAAVVGAVIVLLAGCILLTSWLYRASHPAQPPPAVIVQPTATHTLAPTTLPSITPTVEPLPSETTAPTVTPLPSATLTATRAPFIGVILGNVWMRTGPSVEAARSEVVLTQGERVELLAVYGDWLRVKQITSDGYFAEGWIPARWFGAAEEFPAQLITPTAGQ